MSILLDLARKDPEAIGIMSKPYRAVIFNPLCSCGRELGVLQYEIEEAAQKKPLTQVLNDMKITLFCCRRTCMCAPNYIICSANKATTIVDVPFETTSIGVSSDPVATHLPFPQIPS